jgi:hypothetical protein
MPSQRSATRFIWTVHPFSRLHPSLYSLLQPLSIYTSRSSPTACGLCVRLRLRTLARRGEGGRRCADQLGHDVSSIGRRICAETRWELCPAGARRALPHPIGIQILSHASMIPVTWRISSSLVVPCAWLMNDYSVFVQSTCASEREFDNGFFGSIVSCVREKGKSHAACF